MFHTLSIFLYKERIKFRAENGQWTETFPINHQCQPSELQSVSSAVCTVLMRLYLHVFCRMPCSLLSSTGRCQADLSSLPLSERTTLSKSLSHHPDPGFVYERFSNVGSCLLGEAASTPSWTCWRLLRREALEESKFTWTDFRCAALCKKVFYCI